MSPHYRFKQEIKYHNIVNLTRINVFRGGFIYFNFLCLLQMTSNILDTSTYVRLEKIQYLFKCILKMLVSPTKC